MANTFIKPKVYLSGGFRSDWQAKVIRDLGDSCVFFNPRAHQLDDPVLYCAWDIHFVKECDIVFAYMEQDNPSGYGLSLEVGLAYGLGKTIILVDEKSTNDLQFQRYFQLISSTAHVCFRKLDDGIEYLKKFTSLTMP